MIVPRYEALKPRISVRDSRDKPFRLLSEMGIAYQFSFDNTREGPGFWSFGISPTCEFAESDHLFFLALIKKIKSQVVGEADWPGFGDEVFHLHDELAEVLRGLKGARGSADILVSFEPGEVRMGIEKERKRGFGKAIQQLLKAEPGCCHKAALAVASGLRRDVESIRKWTEDRIEDSRKRGEWIKSIFGL